MSGSTAQVVISADPIDAGAGNDWPVSHIDPKDKTKLAHVGQIENTRHSRPASAEFRPSTKPNNLGEAGTIEVTITSQMLHTAREMGLFIELENQLSGEAANDDQLSYTSALATNNATDFGEVVAANTLVHAVLHMTDREGRTFSVSWNDKDTTATTTYNPYDNGEMGVVGYNITHPAIAHSTTVDFSQEINRAIDNRCPHFAARVKLCALATSANGESTTLVLNLVGTDHEMGPVWISPADGTGSTLLAPVMLRQKGSSAASTGAKLIPTYMWIDSLELYYGGSNNFRYTRDQMIQDTLTYYTPQQLAQMTCVTLDNYAPSRGVSMRSTLAAPGVANTVPGKRHVPPKYQGAIAQGFVLSKGEKRWVYIPICNTWLTSKAWFPSLNNQLQLKITLAKDIFAGITSVNRDAASAQAWLEGLRINKCTLRMYGEAFIPTIANAIQALYRNNTVFRRMSVPRGTNWSNDSLKVQDGSDVVTNQLALAGTFSDFTFRTVVSNTEELSTNLCFTSVYLSNLAFHQYDTIEIQDASGQPYNLSNIPARYKECIEPMIYDGGALTHHLRLYRWVFNRRLACFVRSGIADGRQYVNGQWTLRFKPPRYVTDVGLNQLKTVNHYTGDGYRWYLKVNGHQFATFSQMPSGAVSMSFY